MKILIVNTFDIQGGAARAAYRLHCALLENGNDSQMLVQFKSSDDYTVKLANASTSHKVRTKIEPVLDKLYLKRYKNRSKTPFSAAWIPFSDVVKNINAINPDVVHLHWICKGLIRIEDIARIKAPIVWSLHDMWAFTGGCHYDENCGAFVNNCGNCKVLSSKQFSDLSQKIFKRKQRTYSCINNKLTVVAVSQWLKKCALSSSLFKNTKVVTLPNPLDVAVYRPMSKVEARELLNLPLDKKLVLFGAISATGDPRKGFKELSEALSNVSTDIELIIFGSSKPEIESNLLHKTHYLGHLHDDVSLRILYNAADLMVVPSLQEAFGQTASESLSCGTPVVAFGATGLLDIVDHKINGYLASPFDTRDLANGIDWILNTDNYDDLCLQAREKALRDFDSKILAKKYISLYQETLDRP